jgi:hypothetical protein
MSLQVKGSIHRGDSLITYSTKELRSFASKLLHKKIIQTIYLIDLEYCNMTARSRNTGSGKDVHC